MTACFMCFHRLKMTMGEAVQVCDVLVIGAGPGGGSAGLHASRAGLKTIIVEADRFEK